MKRLKFITALLVLGALAASVNVSAHPRGGGGHWHGHGHGHWRGHVGFYVGVPLGAALYPYYAPRVVTVPAPQVVYVEQSPPPQAATGAAPLPAGWWYYCPNPAGYYPYVQTCTQPWQPVEPRPPTQP